MPLPLVGHSPTSLPHCSGATPRRRAPCALDRSVLSLALALVAGAGCYGLDSLFDPPRVTFQRADVRDVSETQLTMALVVTVENPNAIAIDLQQLGYRLSIDGRTVAEGASPASLHVRKRGAGELTVPLTVTFGTHAPSVRYAAHLDFGFATSAGILTVPVEAQGTLPVRHPGY